MGFSDVDADDTAIDGYVCDGSGELVPLRTPSLLSSSPPLSLALLLGDEPPPLVISIQQPSTLTGRLPQRRRVSPQPDSDLVGRSPSIEHECWGTSHRLPMTGQTAWDGISTMPRLVNGCSATADGGRESEDESSCCDSGGDSCCEGAPVVASSTPPCSRGLPSPSAANGKRARDWPGTAAAVAASLNASLPADLQKPIHSWRPPRSELPKAGSRRESRGPPPPPLPPVPAMLGRHGRKSGHSSNGRRKPNQSPGSPDTPPEDNRCIASRRPAHPRTAVAAPSSAVVATTDTVAKESPLPLPAPPRPQQRRSPAEAAAAVARASALARFRHKKRRGDFSGATRYVRRAVESTRRARLGGRFVSWAEYTRLTGQDAGGAERGGQEGDR